MFKITNSNYFYGLNKKKSEQKENKVGEKPDTLSNEEIENLKEAINKDNSSYLKKTPGAEVKRLTKEEINQLREGINSMERLYTKDDLKEQGLTDEEIEKYFSYSEKTECYSLKSKTINGHEYKSVEDAIKAIIDLRTGFVNTTTWTKEEGMSYFYPKLDRTEYKIQDLKDMGFKWDSTISKYFQQSSLNTRNVNDTKFRLKPGLKADGKPINTVSELLDAIKNEKKITDTMQLALDKLKNGALSNHILKPIQ